MREIKFRAWNEARREMSDNVQDCPFFGEILNSTDDEVMQFTGLKDKNGKEIYEGDIVCDSWKRASDDLEIKCVREVFWSGFGFEMRNRFGNYYSDHQRGDYFSDVSDMEIIGNIYENPELLK